MTENGVRIHLPCGRFALVDECDVELVSRYKWHGLLKPRREIRYAVSSSSGANLLMHRLILNAPRGVVVDHRNHDGLDNRRANIRLCTPQQNVMNSRRIEGSFSRYKGVWWHKPSGMWTGQICHNAHRHHLGYFKDEEDAARAYDAKARVLFGEFACLNFPAEATP